MSTMKRLNAQRLGVALRNDYFYCFNLMGVNSLDMLTSYKGKKYICLKCHKIKHFSIIKALLEIIYLSSNLFFSLYHIISFF